MSLTCSTTGRCSAYSTTLTNVDRHAAATEATVTGRMRDDTLVLEIEDDGRGGARGRPQSGIAGLAARLAVVDGSLSVSSPVGGPTLIRVEIPWLPARSA